MTVASDAAAPSDSGPDAAVEKRGRRRKRRRPNSGEAEVEAEAAPGAEDEQPTAASDESQSAGRRRYIVFVGNLPYRVSVADVQRLFSAMRPVGCRLPTDKANRKPKGYAFVEFDDAACMRVTQHDTAHCQSSTAAARGGATHTAHCVCLCLCGSARCSCITACWAGGPSTWS